jgi:mannose-6-phosphate isomerase-like protein (cupin superfamily)
MTAAGADRLFPGGTGVTNLTVYDWSSPDGLRGGSAHVHLACTEGYVVLGGRGRLQTLDWNGYAETELVPMTVAWFGPGVIHRLVNDGDLQILVVMQNGGLPEAGDCVLTFPDDVLADRETYRQAASLAQPAEADAVRRRKDLAVQGFLRLREEVAAGGPAALDAFYTAATTLVADHLDAWRDTWSSGALSAAMRTGDQIGELSRGNHRHLRDGRLTVVDPPRDRRYGMCGRLASYEATTPHYEATRTGAA